MSRYLQGMSGMVELEGVANFRDFGGYAAAGGRLGVGRLYRSSHMGEATDADLNYLAGLSIGVLVDLRRGDERDAEPDRRWPGFDAEVIENDLSETLGTSEPRPAPDRDLEGYRERSRAFYGRALLEERYIDLFSRTFQGLADAAGPIVIHCASGKDRTGLLCALIHRLAGVSYQDIMADFMATNGFLAPRIPAYREYMRELTGRAMDDETLMAAQIVGPDYLAAAFASAERSHGSVEGYIERALGVDAEMRERILGHLLD